MVDPVPEDEMLPGGPLEVERVRAHVLRDVAVGGSERDYDLCSPGDFDSANAHWLSCIAERRMGHGSVVTQELLDRRRQFACVGLELR